jgi:hypothetical protein
VVSGLSTSVDKMITANRLIDVAETEFLHPDHSFIRGIVM